MKELKEVTVVSFTAYYDYRFSCGSHEMSKSLKGFLFVNRIRVPARIMQDELDDVTGFTSILTKGANGTFASAGKRIIFRCLRF